MSSPDSQRNRFCTIPDIHVHGWYECGGAQATGMFRSDGHGVCNGELNAFDIRKALSPPPRR
jgi:hypothetical protein